MNTAKQPTNKNYPQHNPIKQHQSGKFFGTLFFIALIIGMTFFTLYMIELDNKIVSKFEGKRWNIPAKVYSRPLELYEGATVNTHTLDKWLGLLNYRKTNQYNRTGSYRKSNQTYYIHTRGFKFNQQDVEAEQVIKLNIHNNKIENLQSTVQNETGIVRLEPVTIGGIYPDNNEDRVLLKLSEVPKPLIDALIATEDRSFYTHHGVSLRGIARAILNNFAGKSMQGGSTLTQQLIKNFYLNSERSIKRKANEALMALLLEVHYDKDTILQTYLNEINLGQNGRRSINGFGLAAEFYFNRPLKELTLDQQALLVGLAKGPSYYNPRRNPKNATKRRNTVLHNMLIMEKISQKDYEKAIKRPLGVVKKPVAGKSRFPAFLDTVKRELNEFYYADDLKNEGLKIISTLDPLVQNSAQNAVNRKIAQLRGKSKRTRNLQSALVSADPTTGELLAVVGGSGNFTGFNRAIDAKRQVGSLLKPIIYLNALERGKYNLLSPIDDSPIEVELRDGGTWIPKNYSGVSHGQVALLTALTHSYNQATVRLGEEIGLDNFINTIHKMGVKEEIQNYPSSYLGSSELSPLDMLNIYQVFSAGGFHNPVHSIRSVADSRGQELQRMDLSTEQSINPKNNYLINFALQQVIKEGTGKGALSLGKNLKLAGKTGTTNDYRDAWFAGYSGNYVSVVWVGRDDNKPIGLSGSSGALPIWIDYMKRLNLKPVSFKLPKGVEWLWLENNDGRLSNEECLQAKYVPVLSKYIPRKGSECAVALAKAKQLAEERAKQQQWLNAQAQAQMQREQQEAIEKQREYEGYPPADDTRQP
ncbi:MAG: penicillin-binding protein 1B, partial [Moraxellaceae bacterium]|nr:penicillin-binding protein 1B [Moraxellaceae bacterium]